MKSFKEFISEAKQVGTVYHYTDLESLHKLINQDVPFRMYSKNNETISTTRNSNLHLTGGYNKHFSKSGVRIALDGDKISEHHKIKPVAGLIDNEPDVLNHKHNEYRVSRNSGEAEESIMKHPFDMKKYIKHIHIIRHREHDEKYEKEIKPKLDELGIEHTYHKSLSASSFQESSFNWEQNYEITI